MSTSSLSTHALQMPRQHLKSTEAYFSLGSKDQLVDPFDPIRLLVYWMMADPERSSLVRYAAVSLTMREKTLQVDNIYHLKSF